MKKLIFHIVLILAAVLCFNSDVKAQDKAFVTFEYMHVKPGSDNAYLQTENFWRQIHLARQKAGNILDWSVWEVASPNNLNASYQYVVVTVYPKFSNILHPFEEIDIHKVFPGMSKDSVNKTFAETENIRDMVYREIISAKDLVWNKKSLNYEMVSYLKVSPDKKQSFDSFMKNHRKPIAEKIVKGGFADEWWHGSIMFGNGANGSYNHVVCYGWNYDQMFDKLPPFDQYAKEDPASAEGYKWYKNEKTELYHKVLSLESGLK